MKIRTISVMNGSHHVPITKLILFLVSKDEWEGFWYKPLYNYIYATIMKHNSREKEVYGGELQSKFT